MAELKFSNKRLFRSIKPYFLSGLMDDPILFLKHKRKEHNILVDCGQIEHISKRTIKSIHIVLISHAHMDHFSGFDRLARAVLVTGRTVIVFGPPGITEKIYSKLRGYDWNLTEDFFVNFEIREVHPDQIKVSLISGVEGFSLKPLDQISRPDLTIYKTPFIRIEAELLDHHIPSLSFIIEEIPEFSTDRNKVGQLGIQFGEWINQLQSLEEGDDPPISSILGQIEVERLRQNGIQTVRELKISIQKEARPRRIGYMTDVGATADNMAKLTDFLSDISLLFCECAFLTRHRDRAMKSMHMCVEDMNILLERVQPRYAVPIHLSKTYLDQSDQLYTELIPPASCGIIKLPQFKTPKPMVPEQPVI